MKKLTNHFAALGKDFYTELAPQGIPNPYSVCVSRAVADELGLSEEWMASAEALQVFAGNIAPEGSQPLASVYSGHQFGVWAGQLGDGRALLLGELETADAATGDLRNFEIQLKGAGRTPYSRMGDGRAVLRSSIREFLCSEAMHGLGIPTTRALAVVGSDMLARRETNETTAVVTRVAPSFIRFGHFEHFAYRGENEQLKLLADYVIERYYPECKTTHDNPHVLAANPYAALLAAVSSRTATMAAAWQAVGFCHGVMNTDNMSILGLTIDYGPFQFLDGFNPAHICNHSDEQGRYAYNRQPNIAYWNLFCLGQALMPLIEQVAGSSDAAQAAALAALEPFKSEFPAALQAKMQAKLGLPDVQDGDKILIEDVLKLLAKERTDYTIFWRTLSTSVAANNFEPVRDLFVDRDALDDWVIRLKARHPNSQLMLQNNPKFVLRNHLAQIAIERAQMKDFSEVARLLRILEKPFTEHKDCEDLAGFPPDWASHLEISCSS
jgi:uncharacterized protein YdiU (UPF0061 family)